MLKNKIKYFYPGLKILHQYKFELKNLKYNLFYTYYVFIKKKNSHKTCKSISLQC